MVKVYFVRHCEAEGNVLRVFQGRTDLDITPLGAKQLERLAKRFEDIKVDAVYTSPLKRAQKTAHAIADIKGLPVIPDEGLSEVNGGDIDGKPFGEIFAADKLLADAWDNHPEDFAPQNGETMRQAYERIWNTILNIAKKNEGKTVVTASHGGVLRCLICRLKFGDITRLADTGWSDNTAVSLIEFDDDFKPTLRFYYDAKHLPKELIPTRSRLSAAFKR